jgi:RND family efflux transporter MFP subunit
MAYDENNSLLSDSTSLSAAKKPLALPRNLMIVAGIVVATILLVVMLVASKPEAKKQVIPELIVKVNSVTATPQAYPITVHTNGTVAAKTRGNLVAQVSGDVIATGNAFTAGGMFQEGDLLLQIDDRNYLSELSRSQAALSQAQAAYRQEKANAKQAELDWKRLGNTEQAPDLVLRKPQLAAARAQVESAQAALNRAILDLERTKIKAPYTGQMIADRVSLGQFVTMGTPVAEIFKPDEIEVHLPISQTEYVQLGFDVIDFDSQATFVDLSSTIGGNQYKWRARITGTDGIFDQATRQTNVIAKIQSTESDQAGRPRLKLGQFVDATVVGQVIDNIIVIPNESIREGNALFLVEGDRLARREVDILWQDNNYALIRSGLSSGDQVVTTALSSTVSGAKVEIINQSATQPIANSPEPTGEEPSSPEITSEEPSNAQPISAAPPSEATESAAMSPPAASETDVAK